VQSQTDEEYAKEQEDLEMQFMAQMDELGGGEQLAERATNALSRFDQLQQQLEELRKGMEARA